MGASKDPRMTARREPRIGLARLTRLGTSAATQTPSAGQCTAQDFLQFLRQGRSGGGRYKVLPRSLYVGGEPPLGCYPAQERRYPSARGELSFSREAR